MIPAAILTGLLIGRWWAVAASAVVWPIVLVSTGVLAVDAGVLAAAYLAAGNALIGVAVHRGVMWGVRRVRRPAAHRATG